MNHSWIESIAEKSITDIEKIILKRSKNQVNNLTNYQRNFLNTILITLKKEHEEYCKTLPENYGYFCDSEVWKLATLQAINKNKNLDPTKKEGFFEILKYYKPVAEYLGNMHEGLSKTVQKFKIRRHEFEVDELLDERNSHGQGYKVFNLFGDGECIEVGLTNISEAKRLAKNYVKNLKILMEV